MGQQNWITKKVEKVREERMHGEVEEEPTDDMLIPVIPSTYDEGLVSRKIYSRRLKWSENPRGNWRRKRLKEGKMKLKEAEIRRKEKAKTKAKSRSQLRKYGVNRSDLF